MRALQHPARKAAWQQIMEVKVSLGLTESAPRSQLGQGTVLARPCMHGNAQCACPRVGGQTCRLHPKAHKQWWLSTNKSCLLN